MGILGAGDVRKIEVASIVDSILFKAAKRAYKARGENDPVFLILDNERDNFNPEWVRIGLEIKRFGIESQGPFTLFTFED